jgi:hypothetical protein
VTRKDAACLHAEVRDRLQAGIANYHVQNGARYGVILGCTYRDREAQDKALADGASQRSFGVSRHNYIPCYAVDLLLTDSVLHETLEGKTAADAAEYAKLAVELKAQGFKWGGDNPHFIEVGHFEAPVDVETMRRGGSPAWSQASFSSSS